MRRRRSSGEAVTSANPGRGNFGNPVKSKNSTSTHSTRSLPHVRRLLALNHIPLYIDVLLTTISVLGRCIPRTTHLQHSPCILSTRALSPVASLLSVVFAAQKASRTEATGCVPPLWLISASCGPLSSSAFTGQASSGDRVAYRAGSSHWNRSEPLSYPGCRPRDAQCLL